MAKTQLKQNLTWQLFRVAISMKHHLMDAAEQYGLSVMQLYTLCLLDSDVSIPMNSLSSNLHCDASNVTGIVDRLLQQNYIKREENPKDRREKIITLTSKGQKVCEDFSNNFATEKADLLQNLSSSERQQLLLLITKILDSFNSKKKV